MSTFAQIVVFVSALLFLGPVIGAMLIFYSIVGEFLK